MNRVVEQPGAYWAAAAATGAMAIGSLGPWAKAFVVSKSGIDGDGTLTLGCALIALGMLWSYAQTESNMTLNVAVALGLIGLAIGLYNFQDIQGTWGRVLRPERRCDRAGWGIYLVMVGSVVLSVAAFVLRRETPQPPPTQPRA